MKKLKKIKGFIFSLGLLSLASLGLFGVIATNRSKRSEVSAYNVSPSTENSLRNFVINGSIDSIDDDFFVGLGTEDNTLGEDSLRVASTGSYILSVSTELQPQDNTYFRYVFSFQYKIDTLWLIFINEDGILACEDYYSLNIDYYNFGSVYSGWYTIDNTNYNLKNISLIRSRLFLNDDTSPYVFEYDMSLSVNYMNNSNQYLTFPNYEISLGNALVGSGFYDSDDEGYRLQTFNIAEDFAFLNVYNNNQYQDGYNIGYEQGYQQGFEDTSHDSSLTQEWYSLGFADGYNEGINVNSTAATIFSGIIQVALVPVNFFLGIFNFEILGINIRAFVQAILTLALTIVIIRMFTGGNKGD